MRILTIIHPSNHPNYKADSVWNFNRIVYSELKDLGYHIESVGPIGMPPIRFDVPHAQCNLGTEKYGIRLGLDIREIEQVILKAKPDVIVTNMAEQSSIIKIIAADKLRLDCRVINYIHYIPAYMPDDHSIICDQSLNSSGNGLIYLYRIIEGVLAADHTVICSNFAKDLLRKIWIKLTPLQMPRIEVIPPPFDLNEVSHLNNVSLTSIPTFVYNHRIYPEYGAETIFTMLGRIQEPFRVLVTDPTFGYTDARKKLNPANEQLKKWVLSLPFTEHCHSTERKEYYSTLAKSWLGLSPIKPHALWSMSTVDVLATGTPVVALNDACFQEMYLNSSMLANNVEDYFAKIKAIVKNGIPPKRIANPSVLGICNMKSVAARFEQIISGRSSHSS